MSSEAKVETEIHDYMVWNSTHTVPSLKLAQFGHKHGILDARAINDLASKVRVSLSQKAVKFEIHVRMSKGIAISSFDLAKIGQSHNLFDANVLNRLMAEVRASLAEKAA